MEIVFDSSTLILLAKVEILTLVSEDIQITIPETIKTECTGKDLFDAKLISSLVTNGRIKVITASKKKPLKDYARILKSTLEKRKPLPLH